MREELFQKLIDEFREAANGKFDNLTIQGRQITRGYFIEIPLNGYPMNLLHYEIIRRYEKVSVELHFQGENTKKSFQNCQLNDERFTWFDWFDARSIAHKVVINIDYVNIEEDAMRLVTMLTEMEESLGSRFREYATKIRRR
ncbi:hypothetical protein [Acetobacteroides hydrogenigenes]|uniref:Uncharacterized protein n=1 Tax=Acetobacteroides hydrogenigenes TaxID=979970 RepID=A0A4R2EZ54_9BACT|nr:hypothetical protein [Acetobacteroides hydrogenigenes]TCN72264.1 hypothetical protein CLV25_102230 [Acetobacteroides hydrogenigenes]